MNIYSWEDYETIFLFFMNREGEKYNLILYNFKVWITNGEYTEFITPLSDLITSQPLKQSSSKKTGMIPWLCRLSKRENYM